MFKRKITLTDNEKKNVDDKIAELKSRLSFSIDNNNHKNINEAFETIALLGKAIKKFSSDQVDLANKNLRTYYNDMKENIEDWCKDSNIELTHIVANTKYVQAIFKNNELNNGFTFTVFTTELA